MQDPVAVTQPPLRKSRTLRRYGFALLLLVAVGCLPLLFPGDPELTRIAHEVTSTGSWIERPEGYYWDSNGSQIFIDTVGDRQLKRLKDRTGQSAPLANTDARKKAFSVNMAAVVPSPDGKWLLCRIRNDVAFTATGMGQQRGLRWVASSSIFGDQVLGICKWYPDSRRWLEIAPVDGAPGVRSIIHSVEAPDRSGDVIPNPIGIPIGVTSTNRLLFVRGDVKQALFEYDPDHGSAVPAMHALTFPERVLIDEAEVSPDGHKVAYLLREPRRHMRIRWLERFFPHNDESGWTFSVWASRTDGTDLRRIGYWDDQEGMDEAAGLHWSPDGKQLAFILEHNFYTIPAG